MYVILLGIKALFIQVRRVWLGFWSLLWNYARNDPPQKGVDFFLTKKGYIHTCSDTLYLSGKHCWKPPLRCCTLFPPGLKNLTYQSSYSPQNVFLCHAYSILSLPKRVMRLLREIWSEESPISLHIMISNINIDQFLMPPIKQAFISALIIVYFIQQPLYTVYFETGSDSLITFENCNELNICTTFSYNNFIHEGSKVSKSNSKRSH